MIKTICSPHTQIFASPSQAGLVLACMVSMATKQEAVPFMKALAIIILRCTQCWEAGGGVGGGGAREDFQQPEAPERSDSARKVTLVRKVTLGFHTVADPRVRPRTVIWVKTLR